MREAVRGIDVIFHLGAAVGVGQSMYEIAHYMGSNTQGTANLLQALLDTEIKLEKLIVASSMSIYGEGKYLCVQCGGVAPRERQCETVEGKKVGAGVPDLRARTDTNSYERVEAITVQFVLRAFEEGSGGDGPAVRQDL